MSNPILWALGIVLAITQLINLTYFEGLSDDFSDLVLQVVSDNGTYNAPYMTVDKADGAWAVVNATLPEDGSYTLNVLSASDGGGSYEETNDPSIIEVSYREGFAQDFSNLAVAFISPDGTATPVSHSLIGLGEGQWATIALTRPPMAGETISFMVKVGDVQPPSGSGDTGSDSAQNETAPEPAPALDGGPATLTDSPPDNGSATVPEPNPAMDDGPDTLAETPTDNSTDETVSIRLFDADGNEHRAETRKGKGKLKFELDDSPIREISFTGLKSANPSIGVDFPKGVPAHEGRAWSQVYAIDPSMLEFTSATVDVTAKGYALYKCKDWDFEARQCLGDWVFLMDLVPGQDYTIELGPADPGFAERGPTDWAYDSDGNDVLSLVNASDNIYASKLVTTSYGVNASWATGIPPGTAINGSNFKCEMRAGLGLIGSVIREWYNQSSGTWTTVCSDSGLLLPTSDTMYECDVKDYVEHDPDNPVLRCRATSAVSVAIYFDYLGLNMTANDTLSDCTVIGAPGTYSLSGSLSGAPNAVQVIGGYACVLINSSDVVFDCDGYSITGNGTSDTRGIVVNAYPAALTNVTVRNCPSISGYTDGVLSETAENSTFSNITAFNNTQYGFDIYDGINNTIVGSTAYTNTAAGFYIGDTNDSLTNNSAYNNTAYGFFLYDEGSNVSSNTAYNNAASGFHLKGAGDTLTGNSAHDNQGAGFLVNNTFRNSLGNNDAYNNTNGFYVSGVGIGKPVVGTNTTNILEGNDAYNNSANGFFLEQMPNNVLSDSNSYDNTGSGFLVSSSQNSTLENNTAHHNAIGFRTYNSGVSLPYTYGASVIANNTAYNNALYGFDVDYPDAAYSNNTAYNSQYGIWLNYTSDVPLANNAFFNNSVAGVYIFETLAQLSGDRFYNNGFDLVANDSEDNGITLDLANVVFDNPSGAPYMNFTNLTISDILQNETYSLNWSAGPAAVPDGNASINEKYLNISALYGSVSIDSIVWHWLESEVAPYNESTFSLYEHNSSGWTLLNGTPDTGLHQISYYGLIPHSEYGLLGDNQTLEEPCVNLSDNTTFGDKVANSSGIYYVNNDTLLCTGTYLTNLSMIVMNASNITLDCNGANLSGDRTSTDYGIQIVDRDFVTVKNCIVDNFGSSFYLSGTTDNASIDNNTMTNMYNYGVYLYNLYSNGNNITNNHIIVPASGGNYGVYLYYADNNFISGNNISADDDGVYFYYASYNTLVNNSFTSRLDNGVYLYVGNYNNLFNNSAISSFDHGFYITSDWNNFTGNNASNNSQSGFYLNSAYNNFVNNNASRNTYYGYYLAGGDNNIFTNNTAYGNVRHGFYLSTNSNANIMRNNLVYGNSYGSTSYYGYGIDSCTGNRIENDTIYGNGLYGIYFYAPTGNNITDTRVYNHTYDTYIQYTASGQGIYFRNLTIDNPAGTMENFTSLDIFDNTTASAIYYIDWASSPATLPSERISFRGKFVNITNTTGAVEINSINWTWADDELTSEYTEAYFELWKSNGTWSMLNYTLIPAQNKISMANMSPASVFGILDWNVTHVSGCMEIPYPGTAHLIANLDGANITDSNYPGLSCVKISSSDVVLDCLGFSITNNGTAGTTAGILVNSTPGQELSNITIQNCPGVSGYTFGAYIPYSWASVQNSTFSGNDYNVNASSGNATLLNATFYDAGVCDLQYSNDAASSTALNVSNAIFRRPAGDSANFTNLSLYDSAASGSAYCLNWSSEPSGDGLPISRASVLGRFIDIETIAGAVSIDRVTWHWTQAEISGYDELLFELWKHNSSNWTLLNGTPNTGSNYISIHDHDPASTYALLENQGVSAISGCTEITGSGIYQLQGGVSGANISDGTYAGLACIKIAADNVLFDCAGYPIVNNGTGGTTYGILANGSASAPLGGITIRNCPVSDYTYGEYISYTEAEGRNTTLSGNGYNAYIGDSNATLLGQTYYGAGNGDLLVYHSPSVSLEGNLFLNPSGTLENYTNLSLSDAADAEEYLFSWADEPAALPAFFSSFGGKYLNITNQSGAAVLDSASWSWQDSEVGSANESRLALYKYNGSGWTPLNGTPDTGNNTISVSSHNVGSTYALFENSTLMNCPVINASGTYVMGADFYGAPNNYYSSYYGCVIINASNVLFDCNGYTINHTQTSNTHGVASIITLSNVTVRNCNVNGYYYSAYLPNAQSSKFQNNNLTNFSYAGFYIANSYNNISGNSIDSTGTRGIILDGNYNNITNNSISSSLYGIYNSNGDYNNISDNTFFGGTGASGIYFTSATAYNNLSHNRLYNLTYGIYFATASTQMSYNTIAQNNISNVSISGIFFNAYSRYNRIANNTIYNATSYCINIQATTSSFNNVTGNTVGRCSYGIRILQQNQNRLANNTIANTTWGVYLSDSTNASLDGDHISNSSNSLLYVQTAGARNMTLTNVIFDNPYGNYSEFTNISLFDVIPASTTYWFNWTQNSSAGALPSGHSQFRGKFVNISRVAGNATIENMTFHWTEGESGGFNEEYLELWKYNSSGWVMLNGSADTSANTLSIHSHNISSIYAILDGESGTSDITGCQEITSNGSYKLTANLEGSPINASPVGGSACIKIAASDVVLDCDGFNITANESGSTMGIVLNGSIRNVTVKDCTGIGGYGAGIHISDTNDSIFTNNSAFGTPSFSSIWGFYIGGAGSNNTITQCTAHNVTQQGFKIMNSQKNLLQNNLVYDSSVGFSIMGNNNTLRNNSVYRCASGYEMEGIANTTLQDNLAWNLTSQGYWTLGGASETRFINNTARNTSVGFDISGSGNAVANNTAYANTGASGGDGFRAFGSDSAYTNNSAYGNSHAGFYLAYASGINMSANRALNNSGTGLIAEGVNNTRLSGERFFGNGLDMLVNATSEMGLYAEYAIFDSPAGSLEAFTNLSINDTLPASSAYSISWTSNSSALPLGAASFRGKFVNITPRDGAVSIDSIAWHWTAAEESGYIENFFDLYKYNSSGWGIVSSSPDTSNNEFLITGLEPNSDYGILQSADVGECMLIDAQGLFQLSGNLVGANISTPELTNYGGNLNTSFACIKIASSNVTLDCNGYSIVNDGTLNASGIAVAGTNTTNYTNVEIRNCPDVSGYANGIMFSYTQQGRISNTSVSDWNSGIVLLYSSYNNITGNTASDGNDGIAANSYCSYNLFADNTVYNNVYGIGILHYSTNNSLVNNTAYDNNWYGLFSYNRCNGTLFENNTVHSGGDGIYSWLNRDDRIINNTAYNNTRGIVIDRSNYCNVTLNTVYGNQYGLMEYFNANHTVFSDMEVFNNTRYGLYVHQTTNLTIRNIHAYGNGNDSAFLDNDDLESALTTISVFNLTIDSPGGAYQNYTRFNITDTIENDTGYVITWAAEPASLPSNTTSFAGKFANISRYVTGSSDPISIDTIIWNWDESELNSSHNESGFELWKFNSTSWRIVSSSPDAGANTFTITGLNPESTYGILNSSRTECSIIDAPGVYQMVNDYYGAPFDTIAGDPLAFHFCMKIASSDVVFDCNGYGIANDGTPDAAAIMVNGSGSIRFSNITIRNCPLLDSYSYGVLMNFAENSTVSNVTANNSEIYGIHLLNSNRNNVTNNTAYNNQYHGILGENSNHTLYARNVVFDTYASGIVIYYSENVTIADNTAYNGGDFGIYMFGDTGNLLANNTVYGNNLDGFLFSSSTYDTLVNNTARNNSQAGIYLANSFDITINDSNAYWNGIGLFFEDSGGMVAHGGHIYGNGQGVRMSDSGSVTQPMNLSAMVFDNPSGSYQNYTNISLYDSVLGGEVYTINWTSNPGSLPTRRFSFADKFLNITGISGDLSINSLSLHWSDSELGLPYDEASFELWKRNSTGWAKLNATLYDGANTITALNVSSFSDFGILQFNQTTCGIISEAGEYILEKNLTGSPIQLVPGNNSVCIWINSSNVHLDCQGYSITGNETHDGTNLTFAIYGGALDNVSVSNCTMSNYSTGMYISITNGSIFNNTAFDNTHPGFFTTDNKGYGFIIIATGSNVSFNNASYNNASMHMETTSSRVFNNSGFGNFNQGFVLSELEYSSVFNNTVCGSGREGFFFYGDTFGNSFINNTLCGNGRNGFYVDTGVNVFYNNSVDGNHFYGNGYDGLSFSTEVGWIDKNDNVFSNNLIHGNNMSGINYYADGTADQNNTFVNNTLYSNLGDPEGADFFSTALNTTINTTYFNATSVSMSYFDNLYINAVNSPGADPSAYVSFHDKYVEIENYTGAPPTVAEILFHYTESELSGFTEANLRILRWNGSSWSTAPNQSVDAANNLLRLSNSSQFNYTYGIFGLTYNVTDCMKITEPGVYNLTQDLSGSPIIAPTSGFENATACIWIDASDVLLDCQGHSLTGYLPASPWNTTNGIVIVGPGGTTGNVTLENCIITNYTRGVWGNVENSTITNNTAYGISYPYSGYINWYYAPGAGFRISAVNATISFNNCSSNNESMFLHLASSLVLNNTGNNNTLSAFIFSEFESSNAINNTACDNGGVGIAFSGDTFNNSFNDNVLCDNVQTGMSIDLDVIVFTANTLDGNSIYGNGGDGIFWSQEYGGSDRNDNVFSDNLVYNNTGAGMYFYADGDRNFNNTFVNNTLYSNIGGGWAENDGADFSSSMINTTLNTTSFNTTSISVSGFVYLAFNATNSPASPPAGFTSFHDKYVWISNFSVAFTNVSEVLFHYTDAELSGVDEARLVVLIWNGSSWSQLADQSVDEPGNFIRASNLSQFGYTYGLFENPYTGCVNLSDSLTYGTRIRNESGVLFVNENTTLCHDTYYMDVDMFAVSFLFMNKSNIYLDCNDSIIDGMDGNGRCIQAGYSGMGIDPPVENDTIMNCYVRNYGYGILAQNTRNSTFLNNTAFNNSWNGFDVYLGGNNTLVDARASFNPDGFHFHSTANNSLANSSAENNTQYGVFDEASALNGYSNVTSAYNAADGFRASASTLAAFSGCTASNNGASGFYLKPDKNPGHTYHSIIGSDAYGNGADGFTVYTAFSNVISSSRAWNNTDSGFHMVSETNNTLSGDTAYGNYNGFWLESSSYDGLSGNTAGNNSGVGVYVVDSAMHNNFTGNAVYNNSYHGFYVALASSYNIFDSNDAYNNSNHSFYLQDSPYNNLTGNLAHDSAQDGFIFEFSNDTYSFNNSAYGNVQYGFEIYRSNSTLSQNNTARDNADGFYLETALYNNLTGNMVANNSEAGIYLTDSANNNTFSGNTVRNNSNNGVYVVLDSSYNRFESNSADGNSENGFYIVESPFNALTGDSTAGSTGDGYRIVSSMGTNFTNVSAASNGGAGIRLELSNDAVIDPSWFCNNTDGISINGSNNTIIDDSVACNNSQYGIHVLDSNNTLINRSSAYNNSYGVFQQNGNYTNLTISNVTNNTNDGIRFDSASTANTLYSSYVCFNGLDINNQGVSDSGESDRCDSFISWTEGSRPGCLYTCSSMWHRFFGNVNGSIVLRDDSSSNLVYSWNASGFNVYFADYDSDVSWYDLQAIGRDASNAASANDFTELDTAFGTSAFSDNINSTYSSDGSAPLETATYEVYGVSIPNVPVANSTNFNTSFDTGILWDMSDDTGDGEYDAADKETTVWVVAVNSSTADVYGTYDYLIQVPYTLSTYESGNDQVSIYLELK